MFAGAEGRRFRVVGQRPPSGHNGVSRCREGTLITADRVPTLLPRSLNPPGGGPQSPKLLQRADVVLVDGRFSLVNTSLTPSEATVEDLLFVRAALDLAGVGYLLVRGSGSRPVLAVDLRDRERLAAALVAAAAGEPLYARAMETEEPVDVLIADGSLTADRRNRVFRVFRPRVELRGGLSYGHRTGVQVELWSFRRRGTKPPVENFYTRRELITDDLQRTTVTRHGMSWPTVQDMFADSPHDIGFDIDLVFSWVDAGTAEFQRARARRMASYVVGEGDDTDARYRQLDELKYALRSVHLFAPWIRHIFIVTDSDRPAWLDEHPRVTVVRSAEFFADTSVLPTHNSMAIESQLHHIDGLSEHFLYSNDDMFFGRAVEPDMFFTSGGLTRFIEGPNRIGPGETDHRRSGFENAARVNRRLLHQRFGKLTTRHLEHAATPLRRSVLREMEVEFASEFAATSASTFRASTNISVTNSLYHYYALLTGRAIRNERARVKYVDTTTPAGLRSMNKLLERRSFDFFCLNDGSFPQVPAEERAAAISLFLDRYFAISAPWERLEISAGAAGDGGGAPGRKPDAVS